MEEREDERGGVKINQPPYKGGTNEPRKKRSGGGRGNDTGRTREGWGRKLKEDDLPVPNLRPKTKRRNRSSEKEENRKGTDAVHNTHSHRAGWACFSWLPIRRSAQYRPTRLPFSFVDEGTGCDCFSFRACARMWLHSLVLPCGRVLLLFYPFPHGACFSLSFLRVSIHSLSRPSLSSTLTNTTNRAHIPSVTR